MSTVAHDAGGVRPAAVSLAWRDLGLLAGRLGLGAIFLVHGSQKVLGMFGGPGLAATAAGMNHGLHIPVPLAYLAAFTEFLGGIALIVGVLSRVAALGIAIDMLVAVALVHARNGFFMNWQAQPGQILSRGEGFEYHILAIALALVIALAGPGRIAIADWEGRLLRRDVPPTP